MLNMDFSQRVVVNTAEQQWQPSPAKGIERKLLEREEAECGRATSVVRYAPGSRFATHQHPFGEEILVLEGTFSDETGDYPAGTYLRNPPASFLSHTGIMPAKKFLYSAVSSLMSMVVIQRQAGCAVRTAVNTLHVLKKKPSFM